MRGVQGAQVARTPLPEMRALLGGAPGGKPLGEGLREEGMEVSWPFHPRAHLPHTCQPGPSGPHPEPAPSLAPRCGRLPRGPALVLPLPPAAAAAGKQEQLTPVFSLRSRRRDCWLCELSCLPPGPWSCHQAPTLLPWAPVLDFSPKLFTGPAL